MSRSKLSSNYDVVSCSVPNLNTQLPIVMTLDKFEFRQPISRDAREWTEPALEVGVDLRVGIRNTIRNHTEFPQSV